MPRCHGRVRSRWQCDTKVSSVGSMLGLATEWKPWPANCHVYERDLRTRSPTTSSSRLPSQGQRVRGALSSGESGARSRDRTTELLERCFLPTSATTHFSTRTRGSFDSRANGFHRPDHPHAVRTREANGAERTRGVASPCGETTPSGSAFDDACPASAGEARPSDPKMPDEGSANAAPRTGVFGQRRGCTSSASDVFVAHR